MSAQVRAAVLAAVLGLTACAPSRGLAERVAARYPEAVFSFATADSLVALTLDDGPDALRTAEVLDVLRAHDARATFFVIGERAAAHPELLARIVGEGHELGSHGWRLTTPVFLKLRTVEADLDRTAETLAPYGPVRWYRPGSGLYTTAVREAAAARGYRLALGTIYPNDPWVRSAERQARHILREAHPGGVIILHDGLRRRTRAPEVLRRVLPELRRRGYRVVTLSELAERAAAQPERATP